MNEATMTETTATKVAAAMPILDRQGIAVTWFRTGRERVMLAAAMAEGWKIRHERAVMIVVTPSELGMISWEGSQVPVTTMRKAIVQAEAGGMIAGYEIARIGLIIVDDAQVVPKVKLKALRDAVPGVKVLAMADPRDLPPIHGGSRFSIGDN